VNADGSTPDVAPITSKADALAVFHAAQRVTDTHLRRLERLEDGLVRLMDLIDVVRAATARAQMLQLAALRLAARLVANEERRR
jgi:hypothetical protein